MRFATWRRHRNWKYSDPFKGGTMYTDYKGDDKKSKFRVFCELNALSKYWKCYPDSYFRYAMFKKEFSTMERMKSFIPQGAYGKLARNDEPKYQILIDDKILFHDIMTKYGLPVTERFFSFRYGNFNLNGQFLTDQQVDNILAGITDDRIFIKRNMCGEGSGVFIADRKEDGIYTKDGIKLSASNIRSHFTNNEYLFERDVIQNETLAQFNPSSLNTCRITTFHNNIIACGVRFGREGSFVDNASLGGLVVNVDIETGKLGAYGLREYDAIKYYEHPDSHIKFKDVEIPYWKEIIEVVNTTSKHLPYFNSVGFDVACTPDGPVIIEVNTGAGVAGTQMGKDIGTADCFLK